MYALVATAAGVGAGVQLLLISVMAMATEYGGTMSSEGYGTVFELTPSGFARMPAPVRWLPPKPAETFGDLGNNDA